MQNQQAGRQVLWQLSQRFKSKRDLYNYLTEHLVSLTSSFDLGYLLQQYYLPKYNLCSLSHIQGILTNRKRALHRS